MKGWGNLFTPLPAVAVNDGAGGHRPHLPLCPLTAACGTSEGRGEVGVTKWGGLESWRLGWGLHLSLSFLLYEVGIVRLK